MLKKTLSLFQPTRKFQRTRLFQQTQLQQTRRRASRLAAIVTCFTVPAFAFAQSNCQVVTNDDLHVVTIPSGWDMSTKNVEVLLALDSSARRETLASNAIRNLGADRRSLELRTRSYGTELDVFVDNVRCDSERTTTERPNAVREAVRESTGSSSSSQTITLVGSRIWAEKRTHSKTASYRNSSCRSTKNPASSFTFNLGVDESYVSHAAKASFSRCGARFGKIKRVTTSSSRTETISVPLIVPSCGRSTFGDCKGHGAINYAVNLTTKTQNSNDNCSTTDFDFARSGTAVVACSNSKTKAGQVTDLGYRVTIAGARNLLGIGNNDFRLIPGDTASALAFQNRLEEITRKDVTVTVNEPNVVISW